jgi:FAD/FMN-containing dehydrogenase
MRWRKKRIGLVLGMGAVGALLLFCGQPAYLLVDAWLHDRHDRQPPPAGFVDDASRLNETKVVEVWDVSGDGAEAEEQLRALLARARADKLGVAIAGARHSMGGHTICADGIVLNMLPFKRMEVDTRKKLLRVGAGARWSEVIPYLNAKGLSVAIMQSNNDFTIGGSLSVNCHGWQANRPPIASSVESFRLMKADGTIVRCSRSENAQLFALVLGGYGLFGVILDAELRVVANERYRLEMEVLPASEYVARFAEVVSEETPMAYGRLCVVPGKNFLREAILTTFRRSPCALAEVPSLKQTGYAVLRRELFRAQIGSAAGKELRWKVEKRAGRRLANKAFSRNQLFNEPAEVYQEQSAVRTDILQEYFIPNARLARFLEKAREIMPKHDVELMNVTVRNVREDRDSFLRYADRDVFGLVMLFNQPRTAEAEQVMEALTRELIDAALACAGRYYLTYRLHATPEQFRRAYPQAAAFFTQKRRYDPDGLFRNGLYAKYGRP